MEHFSQSGTLYENEKGYTGRLHTLCAADRWECAPLSALQEISGLGKSDDPDDQAEGIFEGSDRCGVGRIRQDPARVSDIYKTIMPYMNTDIILDEAVYLVTQSLDHQVSDSSFYQLTGVDEQVDFVREEGMADLYDDYHLDGEVLRKTVSEVFYDRVTWEGMPAAVCHTDTPWIRHIKNDI